MIIGLSIGLLLWMLYQEWWRSNKKWLAARITAAVVAIISLVFIALPVHYRSKISTTGNEAILLTEGWNKDSIKQFKGLRVFSTEASPGATYVPDLHLLDKQPLHVFGYGLNGYDLQELKKRPYQFHPTVLQNTVKQVGWDQSVALGRSLHVQGIYSNAESREVKLILSAFSIPLDSATLPPRQNASFQLSTVPQQVGRAVFTLTVLQGKDTVESNPIPVEVTLPGPLRLLMLSSAPDFEKKFLKNWLSGHNFSIAIKTRLTNGKWDQQFINRPPGSITIKEFDVVVADINALATLPPGEARALQESVSRSGTGLLVMMDSAMHTNSFYTRPFTLNVSRDSTSHTLQLNLPAASATLPLATEAPLFIKPNEGLQTNIHDQHGRILSATALYGAGRVLATTINNSFVWQLSGQAVNYNLYWSQLLTSVAPKLAQHNSWQLTTALPRKNEPVGIRFQQDSSAPSLQAGETILYPVQDHFLPGEWNTTLWPRKAGWCPVLRNGQAAGWFYVYEPNHWRGVERAERSRETTLSAKELATSTANNPQALMLEREVDPVYFFLLFLASTGFLWYEKKRHGT